MTSSIEQEVNERVWSLCKIAEAGNKIPSIRQMIWNSKQRKTSENDRWNMFLSMMQTEIGPLDRKHVKDIQRCMDRVAKITDDQMLQELTGLCVVRDAFNMGGKTYHAIIRALIDVQRTEASHVSLQQDAACMDTLAQSVCGEDPRGVCSTRGRRHEADSDWIQHEKLVYVSRHRHTNTLEQAVDKTLAFKGAPSEGHNGMMFSVPYEFIQTLMHLFCGLLRSHGFFNEEGQTRGQAFACLRQSVLATVMPRILENRDMSPDDTLQTVLENQSTALLLFVVKQYWKARSGFLNNLGTNPSRRLDAAVSITDLMSGCRTVRANDTTSPKAVRYVDRMCVSVWRMVVQGIPVWHPSDDSLPVSGSGMATQLVQHHMSRMARSTASASLLCVKIATQGYRVYGPLYRLWAKHVIDVLGRHHAEQNRYGAGMSDKAGKGTCRMCSVSGPTIAFSDGTCFCAPSARIIREVARIKLANGLESWNSFARDYLNYQAAELDYTEDDKTRKALQDFIGRGGASSSQAGAYSTGNPWGSKTCLYWNNPASEYAATTPGPVAHANCVVQARVAMRSFFSWIDKRVNSHMNEMARKLLGRGDDILADRVGDVLEYMDTKQRAQGMQMRHGALPIHKKAAWVVRELFTDQLLEETKNAHGTYYNLCTRAIQTTTLPALYTIVDTGDWHDSRSVIVKPAHSNDPIRGGLFSPPDRGMHWKSGMSHDTPVYVEQHPYDAKSTWDTMMEINFLLVANQPDLSMHATLQEDCEQFIKTKLVHAYGRCMPLFMDFGFPVASDESSTPRFDWRGSSNTNTRTTTAKLAPQRR